MIAVELDARLPPARLAETLKAAFPGDWGCVDGRRRSAFVPSVAFASGTLADQQAEAFLDWVRRGEGSVVAGSMTWRRALADLPALCFLDLPPLSIGDDFPHAESVHAVAETCPVCGSTLWRQVADLEIGPERPVEIAVTPSQDLIVPARFAAAAAAAGAEVRRVRGRTDLVQIVANGLVDFADDESGWDREDRCSRCDMWGVFLPRRAVLGESPITADSGPVIFAFGTPVRAAAASSVIVARSRQHIGNENHHGQPDNISGPRIPLFVARVLIARLVEAGAGDALVSACRPAL